MTRPHNYHGGLEANFVLVPLGTYVGLSAYLDHVKAQELQPDRNLGQQITIADAVAPESEMCAR